MSSNHPYGGPQPPMPGPGANPGPGPEQHPHRTETRSSLRPAGRPPPLATPLDPSPLRSRPRTGTVTRSMVGTEPLLAPTARVQRGVRRNPRAKAKARS